MSRTFKSKEKKKKLLKLSIKLSNEKQSKRVIKLPEYVPPSRDETDEIQY